VKKLATMPHVKYLFLFAIVLCGTKTFANSGLSVSNQRGLFSFGLAYEYSESRMLNTDSTFASYNGSGFRAELELSFTKSGPGEFRVFASSTFGKSKGQQDKSDVIESQANMFGAKVFSTSWLFLGAGYGKMKLDIEAEGSEVSTSNPLLATGLGIEYPAFGNWYFNASVWYNQVFIKKTEQFEAASYAEGVSVYLGLSWSPPSTVVTQVFK